MRKPIHVLNSVKFCVYLPTEAKRCTLKFGKVHRSFSRMPNFPLIGERRYEFEAPNFKIRSNLQFIASHGPQDAPIKVKFGVGGRDDRKSGPVEFRGGISSNFDNFENIIVS